MDQVIISAVVNKTKQNIAPFGKEDYTDFTKDLTIMTVPK